TSSGGNRAVELNLHAAHLKPGASTGLNKRGQAHAEQLAGRSSPLPQLQQRLPAHELQGVVQGLLVITRIVLQTHRRFIGELIGLEEVAAAKLDWIDAQLMGGRVHDALDGESPFGTASAAVGPGGAGVGESAANVGSG